MHPGVVVPGDYVFHVCVLPTTCRQTTSTPDLDTERCVQVIRVPESFVFQEGAHITEDLVAGKMLGDGVQGQVYVLKRPNGDSTDQLLKVCAVAAIRCRAWPMVLRSVTAVIQS